VTGSVSANYVFFKIIQMSDTEKSVIGPARNHYFCVIARALESEKSKPALIDKTALEIVRKAGYDFLICFPQLQNIPGLPG
jgi:O-methyltransferase involved in polyketide biosynthesis